MSYDKLDPTSFNLTARQSRQEWHCVVDPETLVEDVMKPKFWVHVISKLKPMALVDLVSPDGTLDMQVRVISISNGLVTVQPRIIVEDKVRRAGLYERRANKTAAGDQAHTPGILQAQEIADQVPEGYKVGWNPGKKRWFVLQKDTGARLAEDILLREDAFKYAIAHAKAAGVDLKETA